MAFLNDAHSEIISGSAGSLFRLIGGFGNVSGPGLFMVRIVLSGTVSSAVVGFAGAALGAALFGTASLPFLICSCGGFVWGAVGYYRDALRRSYIYLERYPRLLQLHLDANFPDRGFLGWRREKLRRAGFEGSWVMQSMLLCSWLTAQPSLERIAEMQEQSILDDERLKLTMRSAEVDAVAVAIAVAEDEK